MGQHTIKKGKETAEGVRVLGCARSGREAVEGASGNYLHKLPLHLLSTYFSYTQSKEMM